MSNASGAAPTRHLLPLSPHTIGPFFPATFFQPGDNDLTRVSADAPPTTQGEAILLHGQVTLEGGLRVVNGILELWQPDAGGRFRHPYDPAWQEADPDFLGWGRAWTDAEGHYSFRSVMPGSYAEGNRQRAPHVNMTVMGAGLMRPVQTTLFFPDFPHENAADPVLEVLPPELRPRLVAAPDGKKGGVRVFRFDVRLRGGPDEETPFFED
jgi:protocatechuate 3,4-dioxygenase alpha subunit